MESQEENWQFLNDIESVLKKGFVINLGVLYLILKVPN